MRQCPIVGGSPNSVRALSRFWTRHLRAVVACRACAAPAARFVAHTTASAAGTDDTAGVTAGFVLRLTEVVFLAPDVQWRAVIQV